MELSKTVALTALLFIIVLIFTSAISFSAEGAEPPKKQEASFERSGPPQSAERKPGRTSSPKAKQATAKCVYKPVMTERDRQACNRRK